MNISLLTRAGSNPLSCLMVGAALILAHGAGVQAQTFGFSQGFGASTRVISGKFQGDPTRAGDTGVFDDPMDLDSFSVEFICTSATFFDTACNTPFGTSYGLTTIASAPSSLFIDSNSSPSFQFFFDPNDSSSLDFTTNFFDDPDIFADCPGAHLLCQIEINNPDSGATDAGFVSQTQFVGGVTTTGFINSIETAVVIQILNSPEVPEGEMIWGAILSLLLGMFWSKYTARKTRINSRT